MENNMSGVHMCGGQPLGGFALRTSESHPRGRRLPHPARCTQPGSEPQPSEPKLTQHETQPQATNKSSWRAVYQFLNSIPTAVSVLVAAAPATYYGFNMHRDLQKLDSRLEKLVSTVSAHSEHLSTSDSQAKNAERIIRIRIDPSSDE
eukprot:jgi/Chlat1/8715/Chrsp9S08553